MVDPLTDTSCCREVVLNIRISFVSFGLSSFLGGGGGEDFSLGKKVVCKVVLMSHS